MIGDIYAGIGARKTPDDVLRWMRRIALALHKQGLIARSGGARGADAQFEFDNSIIYTPKNGYTSQTMLLAEKYHLHWDKCNEFGRRCHARNVSIILGKDMLTPAKFVVCWTPDGKASGGTGFGIRLAQSNNIPVINLNTDFDKLPEFIRKLK